MRVNENFRKLPGNYLFVETARKAAEWETQHPAEKLIRLGIGDVTRPIPCAVKTAMLRAVEEMGDWQRFRGYGPEQGYDFLRETICRKDYLARGISLSEDEIFISDGIKSDCGAILELFGKDNSIALCDPVYPAYSDAVAICGRAGEYHHMAGQWTKLHYLPCAEENGFFPSLPIERADLVYLCFPNNPTGAAATKEYLTQWVEWANSTDAVLLFDGAYERFITDPTLPHSIFEIDGAKDCAIEFRSFSKTAGFTGLRCGYTVIPKALQRDGMSLHGMWKRRLSARSNGVSYIVQRGAEAVYSDEGEKQVQEGIDYYMGNAAAICKELRKCGFIVYGGENAPYVWARRREATDSWKLFELILNECGVVTTPGAGFGTGGEGFLRLTAFGDRKDIAQALDRLKKLFHERGNLFA